MGRPGTLIVGAAIVDNLARPTRLLAARRTAPPELAGRWEFPGGKVEPGEAPVDALIREVREELAVSIVLAGEVESPSGTGWPLGGGLIMRVWLASCGVASPNPTGSHDQLRWLTPEDWHSVPWLDGDRLILAALSDGGLFKFSPLRSGRGG